MSNASEVFSKKLGDLLAPHGAVTEFCKKTGLNRATVDNWLHGRTPPNVSKLQEVADALGVEPWEMIHPRPSELLEKNEFLSAMDKAASDIAELESEIRQLKAANKALDAEVQSIRASTATGIKAQLILALSTVDEAEARALMNYLTVRRREFAEAESEDLKTTKKSRNSG